MRQQLRVLARQAAAAVAGGDETLARAFLGALSDGRWDATATALGFTLP